MRIQIIEALMERDGLTEDEAADAVSEIRDAIGDGVDPSDALLDFGLELDYFEDLY